MKPLSMNQISSFIFNFLDIHMTQIRSNHDKTTSTFSHILIPKLKGVASSKLYFCEHLPKK
jgi:hypothetical protein